MKILDPVTVIPHQQSKFAHVFDAVEAAAGAWVPVEMDTPRAATGLRIAAKRQRNFEMHQRGTTVYIRRIGERKQS